MRIFLFLFFILPLTASSQHFIGKHKARVKKELVRQQKRLDSLNIEIKDLNNTLVFAYKDNKVQPVEFTYTFGNRKKCISEKVQANCDSCFRKYFNAVLSNEKYQWKKINANQYISDFNDHLLLEFPPDNKDFSYSILHVDWDRNTYESLKGN